MSEIVLVTQNDEPALAFGEYEISADGNTLYVGSAGVSDKGSETIYIGRVPAKVTYGVFSRLPSIADNVSNNSINTIGVKYNLTPVINIKQFNVQNNSLPNILITGGFV